VTVVSTNRSVPGLEPVLGRIPVLRTAVRELFFLSRLLRAASRSHVLHVIACSHAYFVLHVVPAILLARLLGRRVLVNYRGGEAKRYFDSTGKPFLPVLRRADAVTVPSGYLRELFDGLGVDAGVVPNVVDLSSKSGKARRPGHPKRFLCTRNLEPYYAVDTLVQAFRLVRDRLPDADLTLVGEGSERPRITRQLKALGLEGSVTMAGRVDPSQVPGYLSAADVFVNASVVDNYPNAVLEAFASGLPVVTTSAGGIPYLVQDGVNGLLVEPGDAEALGRGMIRLATDPGLYARLIGGGGDTARQHSWAAVWPLLKTAYGWNGSAG
jgi:glycosyltransferase involved in cell wall biosynthesis